jgi:hypothetical protein
MGDKHFTLLELHVDGDLQFGPKDIDLPGEEESADEDDEESVDVDDIGDPDGEGGGSLGGLVAGLLGLIVAAVVLKKLLGGESDGEEIDVE